MNDQPRNLFGGFLAAALVISLVSSASGQVFGPGPSVPALFDDVIDLPGGPPIGASISGGVGGNGLLTQVNVNVGGSIISSLAMPFVAGEGAEINVDGGVVGGSFEALANSEVNLISGNIGVNMSAASNRIDISGGSIGPFFTATDGAEVNISGGTIAGEFTINHDSIVNLSGGFIGDDFTSDTGAQVNISGGTVGDLFHAFDDSEVNITAGEIGNNLMLFSSELNISGGTIGDGFNSSLSVVNVDGGEIGEADIFIGSEVNIRGGVVGDNWDVDEFAVANISGGTIGDGFRIMPDGVVNISGGTLGNFIAEPDSQMNLFGTEFIVDGVPVVGPVGVPITVSDRDVSLLGLLADGSLIAFDLSSTFVSSDDDFFPIDATLTITLTGDPLLGDINGDGEVNLLDVAPFVERVVNEDFQAEADVNQDKSVNLLDVAPFVDIITMP